MLGTLGSGTWRAGMRERISIEQVKHDMADFVAVHEGRDHAATPGAGRTRLIHWDADHKRARLESRSTGVKPTWARVKASLEKMDRIGLMALIHDLGMVTVYLRARNLVPPSTK